MRGIYYIQEGWPPGRRRESSGSTGGCGNDGNDLRGRDRGSGYEGNDSRNKLSKEDWDKKSR